MTRVPILIVSHALILLIAVVIVTDARRDAERAETAATKAQSALEARDADHRRLTASLRSREAELAELRARLAESGAADTASPVRIEPVAAIAPGARSEGPEPAPSKPRDVEWRRRLAASGSPYLPLRTVPDRTVPDCTIPDHVPYGSTDLAVTAESGAWIGIVSPTAHDPEVNGVIPLSAHEGEVLDRWIRDRRARFEADRALREQRLARATSRFIDRTAALEELARRRERIPDWTMVRRGEEFLLLRASVISEPSGKIGTGTDRTVPPPLPAPVASIRVLWFPATLP